MENLFDDVKSALRSRLSGASGMFTVVWCLSHYKLIIYTLFSTSTGGVSEADTKIKLISDYFNASNYCDLILYPAFITFLVLVVQEFTSIVLFYFRAWFDLHKVKKAKKNDLEISVFGPFLSNPKEEFKKITRSLIQCRDSINYQKHIELSNPYEKGKEYINSQLSNIKDSAMNNYKKLDEVIKTLNSIGLGDK